MQSLSKIRWRCRRGTKELDYLLLAYCDRVYSDANSYEQSLFEELLTLQDSQLISLLLGQQTSKQKGLATIVKQIRSISGF